jgi:transposase
MPKLLRARPAADAAEEEKIRKLAGARHAPGDWIQRARVVMLSWQGRRVSVIAAELDCHEETVRRWLHRFNASGLEALADLGGQGRKRRITEAERSAIIALVKQPPPGRPVPGSDGVLRAADEHGAPVWTLDTLTEAARVQGIEVHRSQVRRILLAEGVRWRRTHSWARSKDPDFVGKGRGSSSCTPARPLARRWCAPTSSAR